MPSNFSAKLTDLDNIFILRSETTYAGLYPIGKLWSWSLNDYGQLGQGNITNLSSPKQVGALTNWASVVSASASSFAIDSSNKLWSWGYNNYGQLGQGNLTNLSSPKQVGALTNWAQVTTCAGNSVFAIKTDNSLWFWGLYLDGTMSGISSPQQIGSLTDWNYISGATDSDTVFAIKNNSTLWTWGYNYYGLCGLGHYDSYIYSPVQVGSLNDWKTVSAGTAVIAIKTNGTLWSWGRNIYGELGLSLTAGPSSVSISSPVQVGSLTDWSKISVCDTVGAIKIDGTLWTWGKNTQGQLGHGNTTPLSSPKQVGALTDWSKIAAGNDHILAIKTDGTLWSCGLNNYGQLGQGNITNLSSPKQVGALTNWSRLPSLGMRYNPSFVISYL